MSVTEEADSGEEATEDATEDATEQQEEDATTAADDKWIHSAAKKSLRTDIIAPLRKPLRNNEKVSLH
jgi:hypothetical protein